MTPTDYTGVIVVFGPLVFMAVMIWLMNHIRSTRVNAIIDDIKARGPVATISMHGDGTVTVEQHKTPDDIRHDVAAAYGVCVDRVSHMGDGHYQIAPPRIIEEELRDELTEHPL